MEAFSTEREGVGGKHEEESVVCIDVNRYHLFYKAFLKPAPTAGLISPSLRAPNALYFSCCLWRLLFYVTLCGPSAQV